MGQQQLLLVILVTIIVGIATVVAINTFGSAADSANVDAVRQDMAQIAASSQGYYAKPNALGGGNQSFTGITFDGMAFPSNNTSSDGLTAVNENGTYVLVAQASGDSLQITGYPSSDPGYTGDASTSSTSGGSVVGTAGADTYSITTNYSPGSASGG